MTHKPDATAYQLVRKNAQGKEAWAYNDSLHYVSIYIRTKGSEPASIRISKAVLKKLAERL